MQNVISLLQERGFVDQITSEDLKSHVSRPIRLYLGFDPTAESLHLGNLVGIMALAWFQKCGHTVFPLLGGATGRIGDPSGKSTERPLLDSQALTHNVRCLEAFFQKILPGAHVLNNLDWLGSFSVIDFLRDVGKHFRMGPMLGKEMVRTRLQSEEGLSFTEFSYQVLQGYDFYHLHQTKGITLQLGGSDQWGNIVSGIELNRKLGGEPLFGMTWPLLTRSDGKKFGKSEEGAIWLSAEKLSPYKFYQYLVRIPDADVIGLLKKLTFLSLQEIAEIEESMSQPSYVPNTAQKRLAEEVTRFIHGVEGLQAALRVTEEIHAGGKLSGDALSQVAEDMPSASLTRDEVVGQKFTDAATKIGLTPSKAEAVRLIKNGGAYINHDRVIDPAFVIEDNHLIDGAYLVLSAGKKKKILIRIV